MKKSASTSQRPATQLISERIAELTDWRGKTLARMRKLIKAADPDVVEEWKWGNPVWSHEGLICTGESYKNVVKLTFARGAFVPDPKGLFNSSLEGNARRAIDIPEGAVVDEAAFKALVREAVALNRTERKVKVRKTSARGTTKSAPPRPTPPAKKVVAGQAKKAAKKAVAKKVGKVAPARKPGANKGRRKG